MANSSEERLLCDVCDAQHITKYAEMWCPECEEGFCSDCEKHHRVSKATRLHDIIPVHQYKKLPSSVSEIAHHCNEHGIKYTNYCPQHNTLCCPDCISTTHVNCTGYLSVQQIIKTSKTSTLLDNMERSLNDIERNIEEILHNRKQNLAGMQQQRQEIRHKIKKVRTKINYRLNALEFKFMKQLNAAEKMVKSEIEHFVLCLSKEQSIVHELKNNIKTLKEHGSDLQTFFGCQAYQHEVEKVEKYIESLSLDGSLNRLNLKCHIDGKMLDKFSQSLSFVSISIEKGPPTLVLKKEKEKEAQISAIIQQQSPTSIKDIKLSLLKTYSIPEPGFIGYRGCIVHNSDKLILTDRSKSRLVVLNNNGIADKEISCSAEYVYDVTTIDDGTVAVSASNGIHIINIDTKQTEKIIRTSHQCYGITFTKGTLLWCEQQTGIKGHNLSGKKSIINLVKQDNLPINCYLTAYGGKIYQTNYRTESVTCYSIDGQKQWEYKNKAVLRDPKCITVDKNSFIYVTCRSNNSVVVLTPDGKEGRKLLEKTGLNNPFGIYFDQTKNNLFIVTTEGPALLYRVF